MKVALSEWQGRISPVFDVASQVRVADITDGAIVEQHTVPLHQNEVYARAAEVSQLGIAVLICGAISWPLEVALSNSGIEVIPQTCGEVEPILASFVAGRLDKDAFLMPGCCGRRRRKRRQGNYRRIGSPGRRAEF